MNKLKTVVPHILVVFGFILISFVYFSAGKSKTLPQGDITQWADAAEESIQWQKETGESPLWNSRMFGGMPSYQITGSYVPQYVTKFYFIPFPTVNSFLFYLLLCGYIMFLCFKLDWRIALIGAIGIAFMSYNFIIIEAGHNTKVQAIALAPLVIGALALLLRKKYLIGAGLLFLGMALQVIAGHYQITYYLLIIIGFWMVSELILIFINNQFSQLKHYFLVVLILTLGIGAGVASNAVNIMLTQEYSQETIRGTSELTIPAPGRQNEDKTKDVDNGLEYDYAFYHSQGLGDVMTILVPNAVGGGSREMLPKNSEFVKEYRQQQPGFNYKQTQGLAYFGSLPFTSGPVYFGAVVMFLFIFSLFIVDKRFRWWILAAFILSIFMSMGKNFAMLNDFFYYHLPYYNKLRSPNMATTMAQLILLIPSLLALKQLVSAKSAKENEFMNDEIVSWNKASDTVLLKKELITKYLLYSVAITAGLVVLVILAGGDTGISDQNTFRGSAPESVISDRGILVRNDGLRSLFFIGAAFAALWFFMKEKLKANHLLLILGVLIFVDLWSIDKRYLSNDDFVNANNYAQSNTQLTDADKLILQDKGDYRVYDNGSGNAFNSARSSRFHRSVGGYHAAKLKRIQDIAEFHLMQNNMKVLDMLNTKYFIANDSGTPRVQVNPNALGSAWFVSNIKEVKNADQEIVELNSFEPANTALVDQRYHDQIANFKNGSIDSNATIEISKFTPDKVEYAYNSAVQSAVVFSEIYYNYGKGWQAYIDGKKVPHFRTNYILRGMIVPAGKYKITFAFEPPTFYKAAAIQSVANIIVLLVFFLGIGFGIFKFIRKEDNA